MKGLLTAALVLAAWSGAIDAASAQNVAPVLRLRLGVYQPTASSCRNITGQTPVSAGVDYEPKGVEGTARPGYYFDYMSGSHNGGHVHVFGIGAESRSCGCSGRTMKSLTPFGGAGAGVYRLEIGNAAGAAGGAKTTFGGKLFAGFMMSKAMSIELTYQFIPSYKGISPSGLSLQFGAAI